MVFLPKMSHVFGGGTHAHRSLAILLANETELKVQKQWGGFMLISPSLSVRPLCCTNSNRSIIFPAINILDHGHRCLDSGMHGVRVSWPQMMDLVWMHHYCHFDGPLDIVYFSDSGGLLFPFLLRRLVVLCHCVLRNPELELKICSNATIYFETSMLSPMDLCSISSDLQCSGSFCRTSNVEVAKCIESERCGNSSVTTSGSLPHLQVGFRCPFRSLRLVEAHRGGQGSFQGVTVSFSSWNCPKGIGSTWLIWERCKVTTMYIQNWDRKSWYTGISRGCLKEPAGEHKNPDKSVLCWTVLPILLDFSGTCQHSSLKQVHPCNEPLRQIGLVKFQRYARYSMV